MSIRVYSDLLKVAPELVRNTLARVAPLDGTDPLERKLGGMGD